MMKYRALSLLLLFTCTTAFCGVRGDLRAGAKLYKQKKYGQALASYKQALRQAPENAEASFGAGASAYYLKDYATAQTAFEQAAKEETP